MITKLRILLNKTLISIKKNGIGGTIERIVAYLKIAFTVRSTKKSDNINIIGDVLFINGCFLPHPARYRVSHQREQLSAKNITSSEVMYTDVTVELVYRYRTFVFYRCPYTDTIGEMINLIHAEGKKAIFDIDDLVIDKAYTDTIGYLDTMSETDRSIYYNGIELMQKTLKMCDAATTTTASLAEELCKYVPEVYVNRNCASDKMLRLSQEAIELKSDRRESDEFIIGYFSGSITHNEDLEMIIPSLIKVFDNNPNVKLWLVGYIEIPEGLSEYKNRIVLKKFVDWKLLPKLISQVDINIVPLKDTLFNRAKSENKWMEAALVKVPTIASNVGAFSEIVDDGNTGLLANDVDDWVKLIEILLHNVKYRNELSNNAYNWVVDNCITVTKDVRYPQFIKSFYKPNIAFVLPEIQIRGGILVALKHAAFMKEAGYDTIIITVNENQKGSDTVNVDGQTLPVFDIYKYGIEGKLDKAVATLWATVEFVCKWQNIRERYYLVQGYETEFVDPNTRLRDTIEKTYNSMVPLNYVTISRWCQNWLAQKYGQECKYAMNGLDIEKFYPTERKFGSKIRILIEGNSRDVRKNVDESFRVVDLLDKSKYEIWYLSYEGKPKEEYYVDKFLNAVPYDKVADIYRQCDILLKTSVLESFSYPPLEMMATGGYVVAVPNGGNQEYLVDGYNCLLYKQADIREAACCIERISEDAKLRSVLYTNGIKTANKHSWQIIKKDIVSLYVR